MRNICIILLLSVVTSISSGCLTSATTDLIRKVENSPSYPSQVEGEYEGVDFGEVRKGSAVYHHYRFPVFPWRARHGRYMHLFFPTQPADPIVLTEDEGVSSGNPVFYREDTLAPLVLDSQTEERGKAILFIYKKSQNEKLQAFVKNAGHGSSGGATNVPRVILAHTDAGKGSVFFQVITSPQGAITWKGPYVLKERPFYPYPEGPAPYWAYVFSVPLDIVTSPVQLPWMAFWYITNKGMSP